MAQPYDSYQRDGANRLLKLSRALCALVSTFGVIIKSKYRDNPAIIGLLTAVEALCTQLPEAQAEFDAIPSDDPLPPVNTADIAGIDPNAPDAPLPDTGV